MKKEYVKRSRILKRFGYEKGVRKLNASSTKCLQREAKDVARKELEQDCQPIHIRAEVRILFKIIEGSGGSAKFSSKREIRLVSFWREGTLAAV